MADIIETNTGAMEQDVNDMREALSKVRSDMKGMFDSVTELNSTWSGPANESFSRQFEIDRETFEELCMVIDSIIESMENAKNSYNKCEAEIEQEINRISV